MPLTSITGFEHTHLHTDTSLLDGYGMPEEYGVKAPKINQKFLCITDHGAMGAIPRQIRTCEENKLFPIFGCELYINPMQPEVAVGGKTGDYVKELGTEEEKKMMRKSNHLLGIAYTTQGYSNLVRLSSWGWRHGFYYKPRINHEILKQNMEGIIFTSCCYSSEIGYAFDQGGEEAGFAMVEKYIELLGKEHFYLSMMMLDFKKQRAYNVFIQKAAQKYGLKVTLEQDCHFCQQEDSKYQRNMLMIQTGTTIAQVENILAKAELDGEAADVFVNQDKNLWMKSEEELNKFYEEHYSDNIDPDTYAEAKRNSVRICEQAKGVKLDRSIKLPKLPDADQKLMEAIMEGFKKRNLPKTREYLDRIKEEYNLICQKEFSSYFLIQKMMTDEARRWWAEKSGGTGDEAVGPGRGSGAGALTCYCLRITDVNPIEHDLLFSRFLSPARGGKAMKARFSLSPIGM